MKVKLDNFYLGVVINSLNKHRDSFGSNTELDCNAFLLRLVDEYEHLNPGRKKRFVFQPVEISIARACLLNWRNDEIQAEKEVAVGLVSETLAKFL
jgi:hypothetical protein